MRSKTVAVAVGVIALLAIAGVAIPRDQPASDGAYPPVLEQPTTSLPAAERSTAAILAERIAAVPGFAETCGAVAFELGADVFDRPERLIDAVGIDALACRAEILIGMVAAAPAAAFTDAQADVVTQDCPRPRDNPTDSDPCGMLIGAISAASQPADTLARCGTLSATGTEYEPSQQVICAATYLSNTLETDDPTTSAARALEICQQQRAAARTLCVESLGGLLLESWNGRPPKITTVDDTITKLTTLAPAVERCNTLPDLVVECQTGIVDALVVRHPMGVPSAPQRVALCTVFDEPARSYCVTRPSPPDSEFREEPGNEELSPQD